MARLFRFVMLLLLLPCAVQAGSKSPPVYIGFHGEADANDNPKMVRSEVIDGEPFTFRLSPDISTRHFSAFHSFPAADGSLGVALKLNEQGLIAHQMLVTSTRGRLVRIVVNGRAVDVQRVTGTRRFDGYLVVWQGLTEADLKLMEKKLRRLDAPEPPLE